MNVRLADVQSGDEYGEDARLDPRIRDLGPANTRINKRYIKTVAEASGRNVMGYEPRESTSTQKRLSKTIGGKIDHVMFSKNFNDFYSKLTGIRIESS